MEIPFVEYEFTLHCKFDDVDYVIHGITTSSPLYVLEKFEERSQRLFLEYNNNSKVSIVSFNYNIRKDVEKEKTP